MFHPEFRTHILNNNSVYLEDQFNCAFNLAALLCLDIIFQRRLGALGMTHTVALAQEKLLTCCGWQLLRHLLKV